MAKICPASKKRQIIETTCPMEVYPRKLRLEFPRRLLKAALSPMELCKSKIIQSNISYPDMVTASALQR
jgi:hypothetical protein